MKYSQLHSFLLVFMLGCWWVSGAAGPADRQEISLNGIWDFYPEGGTTRHDIRVPSFWDAPQDYGYPTNWLHMRHGVYRKEFTVPASMRDKEIFHRIDRVSVIAKVFINGKQVGAEDSNGYLTRRLVAPGSWGSQHRRRHALCALRLSV